MNILQISNRIPFPLTDGGAIAAYSLTKYLHKAGNRVTFLTLNTNKHYQSPSVMADICERVAVVDINTDIKAHKALKNLLFSRMPYNAERFVSREFAALIAATLEQYEFDIIHIESAFDAWYVDGICATLQRLGRRIPIVLRAHNVEYLITERLAVNEPHPLKRLYLRHLAGRMKRFERKYFPKFDGILAITAEDKRLIRTLGYAGPVAVMPAGVDVNFFSPRPDVATEEGTLLLFGSLEWMPNIEAVRWFMSAVLPLVRRDFPSIHIHIGGRKPTEEIRRYADDRTVFLHPDVPSAPEFMQQYDVMLVPLLSGGGMRLKIVEAMGVGKAIVSTRVGAEGIATRDRENIMLADTPEEFAAAIREVLTDAQLKQRLQHNARETAQNLYSWDSVVQIGVEFYEQLRTKLHRAQ